MTAAGRDARRQFVATEDIAALDRILLAQLLVAWAGERERLGWWRTDFASEFGGEDLFQRLLPSTWKWATLEAAREAARRRDEELRAGDADPDRLITLFRFGVSVDELIDQRLADLKRSGKEPEGALPALNDVRSGGWSKPRFEAWLSSREKAAFAAAPVGRRLKGEMPEETASAAERLVSALVPLSAEYPVPHFRITR